MSVSRHRGRRSGLVVSVLAALVAVVIAALAAGPSQAAPSANAKGPKFSEAKAFDVSKPLRELAKLPAGSKSVVVLPDKFDRSLKKVDENSFASASFGGGLFGTLGLSAATAAPATLANFEGISNQDNFNIFGFRVNPPDPVGDVGPNHYVEMVNLAYAVYDKTGQRPRSPPTDTGTLWAGFPVEDCTDPSGDPIVRLRPARGPLAPEPVHDAGPEVLRLRRDLADR